MDNLISKAYFSDGEALNRNAHCREEQRALILNVID